MSAIRRTADAQASLQEQFDRVNADALLRQGLDEEDDEEEDDRKFAGSGC
jgi:hypothetical protein